ncbi:MAG: PolC-type DNA polymerase III [Lachnospiraceae bacterium]|nr:PolC-type DNA polymerase III [Lachnospiraceae bacterium]
MNLFEVLDDLKVKPDLEIPFREVEVEKITASRSTGKTVIHLKSRHLLEYSQLEEMTKAVSEQFFRAAGASAELAVTYQLSSQYNPESLWNLYKESVEEEVGRESRMASFLLRSADISFECEAVPGVMKLDLPDSFVNRTLAKELKDFLERMFSERFGFEVRTEFTYHEMKESEKKNSEPEFYTMELPEKKVSGAKNKSGADHAEGIKNAAGSKAGKGTEGSTTANTGGTDKTAGTSEKPAARAGGLKQDNGFFAREKKDFSKFAKKKLPDDPDIFYGRAFDGDVTPLRDIQDEIGDVVVYGKILSVEETPMRNGEKIIVKFNFTDLTDTISAKLFLRNEEWDGDGEQEGLKKTLSKGKCIKLKGMAVYDRFDKEIGVASIVGIKTIPNFIKKRQDTYPEKRIELHAHTTMSDMDAVVDAKTLVKTAFEWGHPGIAITDHGVVQAFPEANHALNPKDYKDDEEKMQRAKDFKIIYGMEAYLVDDIEEIVKHDKGQTLDAASVVFDIETTGFDKENDKIIEIGAVKIVNGEIVDKYSTFINPKVPIPARIEELTHISDDMVLDSPEIEVILPQFFEFCKDCVLVAHNASFDTGFIRNKADKLGLEFDFTIVDTVGMARILLPGLSKYKLNIVAKELGISLENHHRAVDDAGATAEIYVKFLKMLKEQGAETLAGIQENAKISADVIKKMPSYHCIMLCKNDVGRVNLYKMVSLSHLEYYARRPRIPKSLLMECREGLIIGSACEAGELYQAILKNESMDEITRLCEFYDYYEIQPIGNNRFMINQYDKKTQEKSFPNINSDADLEEINKRIVKLGEQFNKPVVATCDVHFLNPEDEVYRRIIMSCKGFDDADNQAPLYLRTTEEMLNEFKYLGEAKCHEVVIENTQKIFDSIEKISPVRPDKCPPVIENSDETLRTICYNTAHSMYGDPLPEIVQDRLDRELNSIITNGFAVMYIIAQKLVWKSNEDGYLVGSRGSVGSSFAATMSGITEVNPLAAHYYCPECFFSDFDSEEVKAYQKKGVCGCDMPDRICPKCGKPLKKDGADIPFETFLGFYGDKEPDIDLNFSGEYQSKAHEYTEVIFGKGQTFRAGTIGTLAEKTAYGYVLKYDEEHGVHHRKAEVERIASGCVGVRRTTGQHPGGIIVLPIGEEIYSFTPVQHPANDMTVATVTTHFDYHSIDHNLLKLDILGHDDPTMIRRLEDLTGLDAKTIPMDDQKVISLFSSTEALGITPEDIGGCDLGSLGLPELGTNFVMQMLRETKPKSFSDMIRISGLSHGTDVWTNNAQTLINEGTCTLESAICTRDDIMTFLIYQGVEKGLAFKIMESVRKGKGLTEDMEAAMIEKGIPDWYIWSCKQIKYMFPKAHACAYVMMAFRVAYFKVYYPLAYYAAYFGIRASAFNYELMCLGKSALEKNMRELKGRIDRREGTQKDDATYENMRLVQEMYARGFDFMPIDIFRVKAHEFQIIDGKLMPALDTIDGLGEKAADLIVEAVKDGEFLSRDDFKNRCKVSQTITDKMGELGLLGDIPASNQMSLMDLFQM